MLICSWQLSVQLLYCFQISPEKMGQEQSTNQGNHVPVEFDSDFANRNNRANQRNPNNDVYWTSRSYDRRPDDWQETREIRLPKENDNNRSKQLNPNHQLYLTSRGQGDESQDAACEPRVTEEATSSMDTVMWLAKTAGQAYLAYEVGRQVFNQLAAEPQQQQEEEQARRQQRRND